MIKIAGAEEMKNIDSQTIEKIGIPGIILMENAALRVVEKIQENIGRLNGKNIVVFAGRGGNGGDAFAVSRHLYNLGANILVILAGSEKKIKGDAGVNLEIVKNMGIKLVEVEDGSCSEQIEVSLCFADAVVDGLLGIGIKGEVDSITANMINHINKAGKLVVSIDIPSGVDGDTGRICGTCVKAGMTVTLGLPKVGLFVGEGAKYTGAIEVVDIGIPDRMIKGKEPAVYLVEREDVESIVPRRTPFSHKGNLGRVLVLAGSTGLTGAAYMAGSAAMKSGSGLVTLGIPSTLNSIMEAKLTEVMTLPLADDGNGSLSARCTEHLESLLDGFDVIAVGPGLGCSPEISQIMTWILRHSRIPVIIDADGINSLAGNIDVLRKAKAPVVLTPHPGEMSRLTGLAVKEILDNKVEVLRKYSGEWKAAIVLKDWRTLTAVREGQIFVNTTGNAGMASGGTGDVLTGIIASLAGQGMETSHAAAAGAYIHGLAGDIAAEKKGQTGMTAGDLLESIPYAFKNILGW